MKRVTLKWKAVSPGVAVAEEDGKTYLRIAISHDRFVYGMLDGQLVKKLADVRK